MKVLHSCLAGVRFQCPWPILTHLHIVQTSRICEDLSSRLSMPSWRVTHRANTIYWSTPSSPYLIFKPNVFTRNLSSLTPPSWLLTQTHFYVKNLHRSGSQTSVRSVPWHEHSSRGALSGSHDTSPRRRPHVETFACTGQSAYLRLQIRRWSKHSDNRTRSEREHC
jgi:hypothetical protein